MTYPNTLTTLQRQLPRGRKVYLCTTCDDKSHIIGFLNRSHAMLLHKKIDVKHEIVCKRHEPIVEHCIDYDIFEGWKTMVFIVDSAATLIVPKKKPLMIPIKEEIDEQNTNDFLLLPKTHALGVILVRSLFKEDACTWNFACDVFDSMYDADTFRKTLSEE